MVLIKTIHVPGYELVVEGKDQASGLHCFIAIHDTSLGPALGGLRVFPYNSSEEALEDVLRLAKGMTYKSAVISNGLGGGKSVIIADSKKDKSEALLLAFAEVLDSLNGQYIVAEDVGTSVEDMGIIHSRTPYVAAVASDQSSGDPSRFTAWGVFKGIQAVAKQLWGTRSVKGKTIAIQGLGHVGSKLADILFWEGADLILTDTDPIKLEKHAHLYKALKVLPEDFIGVSCDILSPCAMGGILNHNSIPKLCCLAVAGAANNQLLTQDDGYELRDRKILYAPDYVINSGGIINAAAEFDKGGYDPNISRNRVDHIYDTLCIVFEKAKVENKPTSVIADELAESHLKNLVGKRLDPIVFH